jgi:AcrR family transcriptional regulator
MSVKKKAGLPAKPARLSRDDWLDAAFDAIVEGGFDKARVLLISEALGVTRGSFYWHFTDHAELISALLARWRDQELAMDQHWRAPEQSTDNPKADLERLLAAALAHAGPDLENIRFELALRGLGRRDPDVARLLAEVDRARMAMFEQKFFRLTGDVAKSADLAALFYLAIVGSHQALSRPINPPQASAYLMGIVTNYLIHQQAPAGPAPALGADSGSGAR